MKLYLGLLGLTTLSFLAEANVVHVGVSQNGDVAVEIDTKQQEAPTAPKRGRLDKPIYAPRQRAHVLDKYEVDLDYEIHSGLLSDDGKFISFKNIPYAEPPEGENRFLSPIAVQNRRDGVNNGSVEHICPQMQIGWIPKALDFMGDFQTVPLPKKWAQPIDPKDYGEVPAQDGRVHEDCLTLTVTVPKTVWDARNSRRIRAATIVWIHGGGFVFGWKDQEGSPEGLFDAADKEDETNIIHVSINYRLGAFGWLGGDKFLDQGGNANNGLLDQEFALRWVADNIHQFGGASGRVTVMGQSAGASSILHHITAYGGDRPPAFQQAILQSPGFFPQPNRTQDDDTYAQFLALTGANNLDDLMKTDTTVLMNANANMTWQSTYGYFKFGPTIDGEYVRDLPGKLLKSGNFHKTLSLMLGYTMLDGLLFTPPWIRTKVALQDHVKKLFSQVPESVLTYIGEKYPISGLVAQNRVIMASDFFDDLAIQCNTQYLTEAFLANKQPRSRNQIYRYAFNALPAVHGYDVGYAYYPSTPLIPPVDPTLAKVFQQTIVDFVRYTDPNPEDNIIWEDYTGDKRRVMNFGDPEQSTKADYSSAMGDDKLDFEKCEYWQTAPFYVPESKSQGNMGGMGPQLVFQEGRHEGL